MVSISLNIYRLSAVCETLKLVEYHPTTDRKVRSDRAIFSEVRQKLFKKLVDKEGTTKAFKLKLKYYEADQLEAWLRQYLYDQPESLQVILVRIVADELNQKLA